jgi:exonuclease VII large subunit
MYRFRLERRVSQDEQLGYIRGRVESTQKELTEFKSEIKEILHQHFEEEREDRAKIQEKLDVYWQLYLLARGFVLGLIVIVAAKYESLLDLVKQLWMK